MTTPLDLGTEDDDRDVRAWAAPAPVAKGPGPSELLELRGLPLRGAATATAPDASWLGVAEAWYSAQRHPGPVVLDALLAAAAVALVTGSGRVGASTAIAFVVAGLAAGLWIRRTCLETQGVLWYARRVVLPTVSAAAVIGMLRPLGVPTAAVWKAAALAAVVLVAVRFALWAGIAGARRRGKGLRPTLVVGSAARIAQLRHRLETFPEAGLRFEAGYTPRPDEGDPADGGRAQVDCLLDEHGVDHVLMAADGLDETLLQRFVRFGRGRADASIVLPLGGLCADQVPSRLGDLGVLPLRLVNPTGSAVAKRALDLIGALVVLTLISPVLAAVALVIRCSDGNPAIFRQQRVGRDGRSFTIYKFRSMVVDAERLRPELLDANVNEGLLFKLSHDPRVTPVGAIIRRLSIDELPQLFNVVLGSMSLVGPRPLPVAPEEFEPAAQVRHTVLPGITGLWQVHGANALRYGDMLDLDLAYVVTRSLGTDLKLLARTVPALLVRRSSAY